MKTARIERTTYGLVTRLSSNIPPGMTGDAFVVEYLFDTVPPKGVDERETIVIFAEIEALRIPYEDPFRHVVFTFQLYIPNWMRYYLMQSGGNWTNYTRGVQIVGEMEDYEGYLYDIDRNEWAIHGDLPYSNSRYSASDAITRKMARHYQNVVDAVKSAFKYTGKHGSTHLIESMLPGAGYTTVLATISMSDILKGYIAHKRTGYNPKIGSVWDAIIKTIRNDFRHTMNVVDLDIILSLDVDEVTALRFLHPVIVRPPYEHPNFRKVVKYISVTFFNGNVRRTWQFLRRLRKVATVEYRDFVDQYIEMLMEAHPELKGKEHQEHVDVDGEEAS